MSNDLPRRRLLAGTALLGTASLAGCLSETPPLESTAATGSPSAVGPTNRSQSNSPPPDLDLENLESFVDERMAALLAAHDIVGASVAVVQDDTVELVTGYGDTGLEDGTAVDEETAFRIGSVSKPLVWTALMQLIEDGRIDPDADVREYLESVSIPETGDEPITVAHLATHTAGFEERFQGTWIDDPDERRPLADVLEAEQPERVRPPGVVASYSNYGTALAAQVVADVTGSSFDEYVEQSVFDPLEMTDATFNYPRPDDDTTVANGYTAAAGTIQSVPEIFLEIWPAGSATATATDMARFVRAHLGDGSVADGRILEPETVATMHDQWFTHHGALPGTAFGLLEGERQGTRVLEHDGALPGSFYSYLLFVPEYDLGLWLGYNTNTGAVANAEFLDAFFEEFLPAGADSRPSEPDGRPDQGEALEGTYRGVRVAESTHAKLSSSLQAGTIEVTVDESGYLVTDAGATIERWVEREPLVFDALEGDDTLAFGETGEDITHLFTGFHAYERIGWQDSMSVQGTVAGLASLGMLSGVAGWPLAWAGRRVLAGDDDTTMDTDSSAAASERGNVDAQDAGSADSNERAHSDGGGESSTAGFRDRFRIPAPHARPRWVAGGASACLFGFVAGTIGLLLMFPYTLLSDPPLSYTVLTILPLLGTVGAVTALGYAIVAWRDGYWGRWSRLHYTIVVASTIAFCWLLYYWNFLGLPV
ncbi:class A beta-lactamase-related serine hydrolase [Salinadaptatus halalkaliphilus]|uniref:Class A beta-lactamase-related serine hydrolase n=1 Tax=Salinadaptatus halalkaliphilus TaxID=2419781 RepID=A0A4S3TQ27_9EURY|nr:serine hydrolase domain-containing protein [Salinadaptatus halalkaliphilus]THE66451.1 class A beta-lactamase-related serine hydrolase [Salinadaptatus halalkaliphilus]